MTKKIKDTIDLFLNFLDGKKTIIGGSIIFVGGGLKAIRKIDDEQFKLIESIGAAITIFGIRHAIKKLTK